MLTNSEALSIMQNGTLVILKLAAPLLLISMAVGVLISILQAATQIHEQTITFVPKLAIIGLLLLALGGWMLEVIQSYTYEIFSLML